MNKKIIIRRSDIDELFDLAPKYEVSPRKKKKRAKFKKQEVEPQVLKDETPQTSETLNSTCKCN